MTHVSDTNGSLTTLGPDKQQIFKKSLCLKYMLMHSPYAAISLRHDRYHAVEIVHALFPGAHRQIER